MLPCLAEHALGRGVELVVFEAAKEKVEEQTRQSARSHDCFSCSMLGALTLIQKRAREAHLMYCKVVFNLSISAIAMIPSAV